MATTVTMPQMGESVVEGTLENWLVRKGDRVQKDQNLCEITTDKVDAELPSPVAGVVAEILVAAGETVAVGTPLVVIDELEQARAAREAAGPRPAAAGAPAAPPAPRAEERPAAATPTGEAPKATPLARRLAEQRDVDLVQLRGSGISGRIVRADVEAAASTTEPVPAREAAGPAEVIAAAEPGAGPEPRAAAEGALRPPPGSLAEYLWNLRVPVAAAREGERVIPFTPVRRRIAEHMVVSKIVSPHVGTVAQVDLQRVVQLRERVKADFQRTHGFGLSYLPFAVQAAVRALREFPRMNATVVGQSIVEHSEIHVGVAVETERGLLVPVVRQADRLSLVGIAQAIQELATRARDREITADELTGGTFTVTNPGRKGNLYGFAVINQPQVGILRTGEVRKTPVVVERDGEDALAIHPIMYLALSYDHRVIDGVTGNGFLYAVAQHLESGDFEL
jgi:2-oxoglutarate dehydrogenase E2 component (dihydrolipoamide succinyltransferase)